MIFTRENVTARKKKTFFRSPLSGDRYFGLSVSNRDQTMIKVYGSVKLVLYVSISVGLSVSICRSVGLRIPKYNKIFITLKLSILNISLDFLK